MDFSNFIYFSNLVGVTIKRELLFLSVILIFLLSLSAVSAGDSLNDNNLSDSDSSDLILDSILSDSDSSDLIADSDFNSKKNILTYNDLNSNSISDGDLIDPDQGDIEDENITKNSTLSLISEVDWKINGTGEEYIVQLTDEDGNPISGVNVSFKVSSSSQTLKYTILTNESGFASIFLKLSYTGAYTVTSSFKGNDDYNSSGLVSKVYVYKTTKITFPKAYGFRGENFTIRLYGNGKLLSKQKLKITVGGSSYTKTTDSKGQVYVKLPSDRTKVSITCTFAASGYYHGSNYSNTVFDYKRTYTKSNVYALLKGKSFSITLKGRDGKILSNEKLVFTIAAKNYVRKTNSKGIAYIKINLARGAHKISYSFSNNTVYGPSSNHTTLHVVDPSGQYRKLLNVKSSASVKKYLYGGGYAKVTPTIKALAKAITKKCRTKFEKAVAIFNYVRDYIDYEYYYNSRKGATKTYKTKKANCCDMSNLIVALSRASRIPARYSHAKDCYFPVSKRHWGHVWAQVYVGGTWYSADATSYKNTFGHIVNWNTKTYKGRNNYQYIPF